jgi:hypothetical protein
MNKENSYDDSNSSTIPLDDFNPELIKIINNTSFLLQNTNSINLIDNNNNALIASNHFIPKIQSNNNHNKNKQLDKPVASGKNEEKRKYCKKQGSKTLLTLPKNNMGRKRKNDPSIGKHNKYTGDNLRRKCKQIILSSALDFINKNIKKIYNNNIGNGIFRKELLPLKNCQQYDITINFNYKLLNKTLGEIFSENISSKYTNYLPNHNQMIIKRLLDEKDEDKKSFFKKLFKITFSQCLKRFIGIDSIEELDGFKTFYEYKEMSKDEPDYIDALKFYFLKFEEIINNSKQRQLKSKKDKEEL